MNRETRFTVQHLISLCSGGDLRYATHSRRQVQLHWYF